MSAGSTETHLPTKIADRGLSGANIIPIPRINAHNMLSAQTIRHEPEAVLPVMLRVAMLKQSEDMENQG